MNAILELFDDFKIVSAEIRSSEDEIGKLISFSKIMIPKEYIEIIQEKTEIEIEIAPNKYIRIWGASGCIEMNDAYKIQHYIDNSLAIADNESCDVLIYANGVNGFGLYIVALNDLEVDEMQYVAKSLSDFLKFGKGTETILRFY